ncbi:L-serine ammonia-lyase [Undibacterium umbellatum]|uniref:L-serine dehydratase n=1 Tax=Undibacterium umbellatum TaxID=2762300 RepID=A0ABR6Z3F9_9BURK|nr:L-serine ammonia-lyase [Undibacterium umbellatum]MBC3906267.1 L-serine ammonia-lyase [Undibacterium umbellatum]
MDMRVFELFKIGVGPSSSHTVGPMLAARRFLLESADLYKVSKVQVALYGSLALTGHGHATDKAVLLGLMGETPQDLVPESVDEKLAALASSGKMNLLGEYSVKFDVAADILWFKQEVLPGHPNGMKFILTRNDGSSFEKIYYSTGGGFIYSSEELANPDSDDSGEWKPLPYPFGTMAELLAHGKRTGLSITDMMRANENVYCSDEELDAGLDRIWSVMKGCISRGLQTSGELPGGLHVKRRAAKLWRAANETADVLPHDGLHRVSLYAMAVNEENAAGGRVVTAPTNGAAGIIPAVLRYYAEDCKPSHPEQGIRNFMLAASAIGMLCKKNASISGAEIGCQGEVGVACAMAAAGLTAALGGTNEQIESAAEIGIEHHLGMTCDPIGGLVQIPCIERNGMGAVKAITAASLSLRSDGTHHVSLDDVIETMRATGFDMQAKYKETSLGGLAVHVVTVNYAAC